MDKIIIFDMDGVLFDTEQLVRECWKKIADNYKIAGIEEVFYRCIGTNSKATKEIMIKHYGNDFPYTEFREKASLMFHQVTDCEGMPMKPGVVELLEFLKSNEYKIGLASSTRIEVVKAELKQMNLLEYFDVVIGGDMVTNSKPDPEIFLKCQSLLGGSISDTYVIEDSYNGIRAAHRAGMKPIMVPDLIAPDEEMENLSYCIKKSLLEVKELLKKIDWK